ncbi:MAG: zinc-ribbon domain-containing protein, partial [Polyangiaceae bacterium]|nr:zinc-ribbon domain-containing protein [Polyangiaceae bacterium]
MKIVCDNCGAKYSIADEKVAGKVFKIRCKKCSDVIVVRGDQVPSDEEEATRVFDYGGEAVWHVVVNGEQQGPYAPLQIGGLLTDGTIDWEAYVWKEGFDGWKPVRDVPELVEALSGPGGPAPLDASAAVDAPAETIAEPEAKADLFGGAEAAESAAPAAAAQAATAAAPAAASAAAKPAAKAPAADLFATPAQSSPFGGDAGDADDQDVVASQPSPRVSLQQASMTGQRNENSVLFSLSNLQALATGNDAPSPAASAAARPAPVAQAPAAGHAMGEGSGLIDIRALASAASAPKPASSGGSGGAVDDLLSIGTGPVLGGGLGAPVLAPVVEKEESGPNLKILYGLVGILAVGLIGAVGYMATRAPQQIVVTQEVPVAAPTPANAEPIAPTTVAAGGAEPPATAAAGTAVAEPQATPTTP